VARAEQAKLYRSFVKGLITEASYLTYPEDSSTDEDNTILSRKGNRTRRPGIEYENFYQLVNIPVGTSDSVVEFMWKAVNNEASTNLLCLQVGSTIHFFSLEENPISDSLKGFTIDLTTFAAPDATAANIAASRCEFSSGKGYLFVVNPYVEPIIVEYSAVDDTITVTPIIIMIRDFEGVNDELANDEEPSTLSKEHQYNLMNQGWVTPGRYVVPGGVTVDTDPIYYDPYTGYGRYYGDLI
jgi:hypothetical protein